MTTFISDQLWRPYSLQRIIQLEDTVAALLKSCQMYRDLLTHATDTLEVIAETDDRALEALKLIYKTSDELYESGSDAAQAAYDVAKMIKDISGR